MKHCLTILFIALLLVSCKEHEPESATIMKRVVVVYMVAENSLSGYATSDLNEMRKATTSIPDSCQLVVYYDNASGQIPQILTFDSKQGEQVLYQYRTDPISTDSAAMQQALTIIRQKCPAQSYGLVMWSHASGWVPQQRRKSFGIDNGQNTTANEGTEMEISTLQNVLQKSGITWDYIFFDACFMQGVEVAYELRDVTEWCIGSPAEIPGEGAPYDIIMPDLFREKDEVWRIAEDYYTYYKDLFYPTKYNINNMAVVLSAIRTSELEALARATAPLLTTLDEYPSTDGIQQYCVYSNATFWKPEYFDMGSFMGQWLTEEKYQTWRTALDKAVPHQFASSQWRSTYSRFFYPVVTDPDHIACLSMYLPVEGHWMNDYYRQTAWWKRVKYN